MRIQGRNVIMLLNHERVWALRLSDEIGEDGNNFVWAEGFAQKVLDDIYSLKRK